MKLLYRINPFRRRFAEPELQVAFSGVWVVKRIDGDYFFQGLLNFKDLTLFGCLI